MIGLLNQKKSAIKRSFIVYSSSQKFLKTLETSVEPVWGLRVTFILLNLSNLKLPIEISNARGSITGPTCSGKPMIPTAIGSAESKTPIESSISPKRRRKAYLILIFNKGIPLYLALRPAVCPSLFSRPMTHRPSRFPSMDLSGASIWLQQWLWAYSRVCARSAQTIDSIEFFKNRTTQLATIRLFSPA